MIDTMIKGPDGKIGMRYVAFVLSQGGRERSTAANVGIHVEPLCRGKLVSGVLTWTFNAYSTVM